MNLGSLDFNLLKVLDALIGERNVTRAGVRLGRSQPAAMRSASCARSLATISWFAGRMASC
jgi:hypothetical protein